MQWSERPPVLRARFVSLQRPRFDLRSLPVAVAHLGLVRPMCRAFMLSLILFAALMASAAMATPDLPLLCEEDLVTGHRRCGISRSQAREVIRLVRTIPGVSHEIVTIDALDLPQVVVTTGEPLRRGHTIFLRRAGRRWIVEKKVSVDQERLDHFGRVQGLTSDGANGWQPWRMRDEL